jgi:hypothetical protein
MRLLPVLIVLAIVIATVVWSMQRVGRSQRSALPPASATGQPAVLAAGADQGPGHLRLTPTQLVFTADAGRVLVIERLDITGATTTHDLPDHHAAAPVLVVRTDADVYYFLVADPEAWVRSLT